MKAEIKAVIMVNCPEWIEELSFEEKAHVVDVCRKKAEFAWNDQLDSFGRAFLAKKALEKQGQMSVFDYV
jgi:hypothetical protein